MTEALQVSSAAHVSSLRVGIISARLPGVTPGGSEAVAAWMAQALQAHYQVTLLLADSQLSLSDLDRLFGTNLASTTLTVRLIPLPWGLRLVNSWRKLKHRFVVRYYHRIADEFDLLISASGEGHFKYPGIQYIHFPRELQGFPSRSLAYRLYRKIVDLVPSPPGSFLANLTLTNSKWTATHIARAHGITSTILPPPIVFSHPLLPWSRRERGFLIVGRLSPEKRVEAAFKILWRVRRRGFDVHLHVIGGSHDPRYARLISRMAGLYGDWITFEGQLQRARLEELITTHQYGIHCMQEEHFGMAVAEMIRGGCIVFVPNGGGQVDIVGDPRCVYENVDDAAEKICRVLSSDDIQGSLRLISDSRTVLTRPDDFCRAFVEHCRVFLEDRDREVSVRRLLPSASDSKV